MSRKRKQSARRAKIAAVVLAVSFLSLLTFVILNALSIMVVYQPILIVLGGMCVISLVIVWLDGETASGGLDYADQIRHEKRKKREATRKQTGESHA